MTRLRTSAKALWDGDAKSSWGAEFNPLSPIFYQSGAVEDIANTIPESANRETDGEF